VAEARSAGAAWAAWATGAVRRPGAVHFGGHVRRQRGGHLVGLSLGDLARSDCGGELGLLGGDERVDQALDGLATRRAGDLGERLAGLERREQVGLGDTEVRGGGSEVVATSTAVVAGRAAEGVAAAVRADRRGRKRPGSAGR
jgi:hypothetical protein